MSRFRTRRARIEHLVDLIIERNTFKRIEASPNPPPEAPSLGWGFYALCLTLAAGAGIYNLLKQLEG